MIHNTKSGSGFDSEYEKVNTKNFKNKFISLQTAVQRRTIVKIPL